MKWSCAVIAATTLAASCAWAQAASELHVEKRISVAGQNAGIVIGPFECDASSNVFLLTPPSRPGLPDTVLKVSADGKKTTRFSLNLVPDFEKSQILAYAVGSNDEVYMVTVKEQKPYLIRFDKDGEYSSSAKLDAEKAVFRQLAVFDADRLFLGGSRRNDATHVEPLSEVFDERGQFLGNVTLTKDIKPPALPSANPAQLDKARRAQLEEYSDSLALSIAESGHDGYVYFVRFNPNGPVYVVSAAGRAVNTFALTPPKDGFDLLSVKASQGRVAIAFQGEAPPGGTAPVRILVFDPQSGKKLAEYFHQNWEIGTALACYTPDEFTFISSDEQGKMQLVHASAR